jgi:hypothetical protein
MLAGAPLVEHFAGPATNGFGGKEDPTDVEHNDEDGSRNSL